MTLSEIFDYQGDQLGYQNRKESAFKKNERTERCLSIK